MSSDIHAIILAAGASTRMGGTIKQLLPWKDSTLLGTTIKQATQIAGKSLVVLGSNVEAIRPSIPDSVEVVVNSNWQKGMGSSISFGVGHILKSGHNPSGILILLSDQPLVDRDFLHQMRSTFLSGKYKIVATKYGNKAGVPAIFDHSIFSELTGLGQDFGARDIIKAHIQQTFSIDPVGREIDIDTLDIYNQLIDK
ncbi:nucleotidyltransferase family protein [Flagellimonas flava]|uniref:Molybdenum cofactor cytidylyltransferase n=1 Tax=Flagellimonas flava TaxID=570519 RepID=A0A1M5ISI1_9FLAO|nr:nucleotidyltransferase family protein [Allomuricauda flava]SHG31318.1 molybdenum cofactor cytidylyltransferase [Allomuricauda flava]